MCNRRKWWWLLTLLSALLPSLAHAESVTYTDSVPLSTTNWNRTVSIPKFNPSLGKLTGVTYRLGGRIESAMRVESRNAAPATLTAEVKGTITLSRPDNSVLLITLPETSRAKDLDVFDGTIDFAGASGFDFGTVTATGSATGNAPPPTSDLDLFSGTGNIVLPVSAQATSRFTGAGNLVAGIATRATATIEVTYTYTPYVTICGTVWHEKVNVNGVAEAGEPGLPNMCVMLHGDVDGDGTADNVPATTDGNGGYCFQNVLPGIYTVELICSPGYQISPGTSALLTVVATTPGLTYNRNDFFVYSSDGSIGDTVFFDVNRNGLQDGNEPGLPGVTVTITGPNGLSRTQITSETGGYNFPNLPPGQYTVCVVSGTLPNGVTVQTYDLDGLNTPDCATLTLAQSQIITTVDFGYTGAGSIGDRVWHDINGDGVQNLYNNANEPGINNVQVCLIWAGPDGDFDLDTDNITYPIATTAGNGDYLFQNLPAGKFRVKVLAGTVPTYYVQTYDLDGLNTVNVADLVLQQSQARRDADFGYQMRNGKLSGIVYCDVNGNNQYDQGEPLLANATVTLSGPNGLSATAATDPNGVYLFSGLPAGNFTVNAPAVVEGKALGTPDTLSPSLDPGQSKDGLNFGYDAGSIAGVTFCDANNNGLYDQGEPVLSGVTVTLNGPDNLVKTADTDAQGRYTFTGLSAGSYTVTAPSLFDGKSLTTVNPRTVDLTPGQNVTGQDFGFVPGGLGDRVWKDLNENGIQDNNEPGIEGVTLQLKDTDGNVVATATTDAQGVYNFPGLKAGNYKVCVVTTSLPAGLYQTYDLDGINTPDCAAASLLAGQIRTDVDFGYAPFGSLSGVAYCDENNNSRYDAGEPLLSGVVITLNGPGGSRTATTDAQGSYEFGDLKAGSYTVSAPATSGDKRLSTASPLTVTVKPDEESKDNNFGYTVPAGTISGITYCDLNRNCVFDTGEPVLPGVTVTLNGPNGLVRTAVTNGQGRYEFTNLQPATYTVSAPAAFGSKTRNTPGMLTVVLQAGQNKGGNNFGYIEPQLGSISGVTFCDTNCNRVFDGCDRVIANVTVTLRDANGNPIATAVSNSQGRYTFSGLVAGTYLVSAPAQVGSNAYLVTASPLRVTLAAGENKVGVNFGYVCDTRPFRTQTQGGWGATPRGNNPGAILCNYWRNVFPSGLTVGIGCTLRFVNCQQVSCFLPAGGTPGVLRRNYAPPTSSTEAGVFAGQVTALKISVAFSNTGVFRVGLANLKPTSGPLTSLNVGQILTLAEQVLGGNTSVLPAGLTVSGLNDVVTKINENFDNGTTNNGYLR